VAGTSTGPKIWNESTTGRSWISIEAAWLLIWTASSGTLTVQNRPEGAIPPL
jgi:hypothetical protein